MPPPVRFTLLIKFAFPIPNPLTNNVDLIEVLSNPFSIVKRRPIREMGAFLH